MKEMRDVIKKISEAFLIFVLLFFLYISYMWFQSNPVIDTTFIMALSTMVYAIFTFFMFWNMKSSSEIQVRPLLISELNDDFSFFLLNKIESNKARDVKVRMIVIYPTFLKKENKLSKFIDNYLTSSYNPWDYFRAYKKEYDIFDKEEKMDLYEFISKRVPIKKEISGRGDISIHSLMKDEIKFKIIVSISYKSLLDVKYYLQEKYVIRNSGARIYGKKIL